MNDLQAVITVDGNFDKKGAGMRRLRCLSELTLAFLGPLSLNTCIPCSATQGLPILATQGNWPWYISKGWVRVGNACITETRVIIS